MKLAFFDSYRLGLIVDDSIVDISSLISGFPYANPNDAMIHLIEKFDEYKDALRKRNAWGNGSTCLAFGCEHHCPSRATSSAWRSITWKTAPWRSRH